MDSQFNYDVKPQSISTHSKDIVNLAKDIVTNEKGKVTRILYCGPNFSSSGVALFRVVEIAKGQNYLEKTIFDYGNKAIYSNLYHLQKTDFRRIADGTKTEVENEYLKSPFDITTSALYRQHNSGHIRSIIVFDERPNYTFFLNNFYTYWKLRSYCKK